MTQAPISYLEKAHLARTGDNSADAAAVRVLAARRVSGLSQAALGEKVDRSESTITAIEKARQLPSWPLMMWFHVNVNIDPTFFVVGEFSHLRGDVQDALFYELAQISEHVNRPA